eukprot:403354796
MILKSSSLLVLSALLAGQSITQDILGHSHSQAVPNLLKIVGKVQTPATQNKMKDLQENGKNFPDHTPQSPYINKSGNLLSCSLCKVGMSAFDSVFKSAKSTDIIESVATTVCEDFIMTQNGTVCHGAVKEMADIIVPVLTESVLDPDYFCSEFLGQCSSNNFYAFQAEQFVNDLIKSKPDIIKDNNYVNNLYQQISGKQRKTLKVVHISDPHVDFDYKIGADAMCNMPLCCRAENGFPTDPKRQAEQWGSYLCDIPPHVFDSMLTYVKTQVQPDILFWTGDNSPHDVWENDNTDVTTSTLNITNMITAAFQGSNISVFSIEGNHDTWPVNVQDFSDANSNIQINGIAPNWKQWLDPDTLVKFAEYGYYSQTLKLKDGREFPNTKVIGINSQACNNQNWDLIKNRFDPGNEIEWLQAELDQLEKSNGNAILIAHIPPGTDCLHDWGHRFRGLMERYQHIVRFSLFGHTHDDSFAVTQSLEDNKNIGVNLIAGSVTSYTNMNPSFNVIEIDEETMLPINYSTYYFNISSANLYNKPEWKILHYFTSNYQIPDLSPDSLFMLANKILNDEKVASEYEWNKGRQYGQKPSSCDEGCRKNKFCDVSSTEMFQKKTCKGQANYDFLQDPANALMNLLVNNWIKKEDNGGWWSTSDSLKETIQ